MPFIYIQLFIVDSFANGLIKSRVFVPVLSRRAINDSDNDRQNFAKLTADSPCDNVLLEHCLALEFQSRGLIERVYPILLGDEITVDGEPGFAHYFNTGCHPDLKGDVVVKSVIEKFEFHLNRLCLGTALVSDLAVRSVIRDILSSQGKVADGPASVVIEDITKDINEMNKVLRQRTKTLMLHPSEASKTYKSEKSAISESQFGTPRSMPHGESNRQWAKMISKSMRLEDEDDVDHGVKVDETQLKTINLNLDLSQSQDRSPPVQADTKSPGGAEKTEEDGETDFGVASDSTRETDS